MKSVAHSVMQTVFVLDFDETDDSMISLSDGCDAHNLCLWRTALFGNIIIFESLHRDLLCPLRYAPSLGLVRWSCGALWTRYVLVADHREFHRHIDDEELVIEEIHLYWILSLKRKFLNVVIMDSQRRFLIENLINSTENSNLLRARGDRGCLDIYWIGCFSHWKAGIRALVAQKHS